MTSEATVFVVDDNVSVCQSLRELLESAGLAVETYQSSEEFLAVYDPAGAGCLVLDVRLRHGKTASTCRTSSAGARRCFPSSS